MAKGKSGGEGRDSQGHRVERVRVKTARGRRASSTRWLQRQLNDPYVQRAKKEGFRSRSTFKLIEMDDKFQFLKPGMRGVELGCAHQEDGVILLPAVFSRIVTIHLWSGSIIWVWIQSLACIFCKKIFWMMMPRRP
jgi:hypothetical protein